MRSLNLSKTLVALTVASLSVAVLHAANLDNKIAHGAYHVITGDFDGDQKVDVLWQGRPESEHELSLSTAANVGVQRWKDGFLGLDWNFTAVNLIVGDFNGDAAGDVILQSQSPGLMTQVMHAEYDGKFGNPVQAIGDYHQGFRWDDKHHRLIVGDFDGDMKDDVFLQGTHNKHRHGIALASAKGTFESITHDFDNAHLTLDWSTQANNIFAGDFDGNGQSELLLQPISVGSVSLVRSEKSLIDTLAQNYPNDHLGLSWLPKDHRVLIGDFNGDGKDDVFLLTTNNQQKSALIPSDGKGFSAITQEIAQIPNIENLKDVLVADFDADGIDDIVLMYNDGSMAALMAEGKRLSSIEASLTQLRLLPVSASLQSISSSTPSAIATVSHLDSNKASKSSAASATVLQLAQTSALQTVNAIGQSAGSAGVSGGSSSYTLPIALPPGRNGMQPSVSLSYSSRAGNGTVGVGWSVNAGQSSIHRCPATVAQDGYTRGVMLDANDKLCLDGQRLIAISGAYGANGTVYRTELESFQRVIQNSASLSANPIGLQSFTVQDINGWASTYSQKVVAGGALTPSQWLLTQKRDASLNTINYKYVDLGSGEVLLSEIFYTGTNGGDGNRKVVLSYLSRQDRALAYQNGSSNRQTQVLEKIRTYVDSANIREYTLSYLNDAQTQASRLHWVQECASKGTKSCLPPQYFEYKAQNTSYSDHAGLTGESLAQFYKIDRSLDFDGDGKMEFIGYVYSQNPRLLFLKDGGSGSPMEVAAVCELPNNHGLRAQDPSVDTNMDGRPEVLVKSAATNTYWARQYVVSQSGRCNSYEEWNLNIPAGSGELAGPLEQAWVIDDFNGDGISDIGMNRRSRAGVYSFDVYFGTLAAGASKVSYGAAVSVTGNGISESLGDLDGDGYPELLLNTAAWDPTSSAWRPEATKTIIFVKRSGTTASFATRRTFGQMGFADDLKNIDFRWQDLNGDGLSDLLYVKNDGTASTWRYRLNTGGNFAAEVKTNVSVGAAAVIVNEKFSGASIPQYRLERGQAMRFADVDQDGVSELLMPLQTHNNANTCTSFVVQMVGGETEEISLCSRWDNGATGTYYSWFSPSSPRLSYASFDRAVYNWTALKFSVDSAGVLQLSTHDTNLVGVINDTDFVDINGDSVSDVLTRPRFDGFGHPEGASPTNATSYYNFPAWANAPKMVVAKSLNQHVGLMTRTYNDYFGTSAEWEYQTLAQSANTSDANAFYYVPANQRYQDSAHFYFASSMGVVAKFKQNNGLGSFNSTNYRYQEAMYNRHGRGFQGFRKIIEIHEKSEVSGVMRYLQVENTFHQKFPLVSRLEKSETFEKMGSAQPNASSPISRSLQTWRFNGPANTTAGTRAADGPFDNKTYLPWLAQTQTQNWDLKNGSSLAITTSTQSLPDSNGNSSTSTNTVVDSLQTHATTQTRVFVADVGAWWPNRLDQETTTKTVTVAGASDTKQTKTVVNSWNTILRKPNKVTTGHVSDARKQLVTEPGYDSFGNVNSISTSAADTPTVIRSTSSYWGSSGYFSERVTDAIGQEMNMTYDSAHGQVLTVRDPFNNVIETRYDAFGRAIWTQQQGVVSTGTPVTTTIEWATATEKVAMPRAVIKTTVAQPGVRPRQTVWSDALNRPLRAQTQDPMIDTRFINQDTVYDRFGRNIAQSIPYFSTNTPSSCQKTEFGDFDVLDRPSWKKLPNDNGCQLTITYSHNGLSTDIQVGPNALYTVQRVKNALGQWWQTTDQGSEGPIGSAAITTSFRYDANGNPTSISRNGIANTALYNDIGQKESMTDPERGTWRFEYSIWGELTKQTDGKDQVTEFTYDNLGRPLKRKEAPNTTVAATDVVTWAYDPIAGITAKPLYSAIKSDTSGSVTKIFGYDGEGLVNTTSITLAPAGETSRSFNLSQSYDGEDRPDVSSMPNARGSIKAKYNAQGFATHSEATVNGSTIVPYETLMTDAFGNTTSAQFGNGLYSRQSFSANTGRITGLCVNANSSCTANSAGNVQGISYGEGTPWYDSYGNLTQQQNIIQNVTETFAYDRRMRLTQSHRVAVLGGGFSDFTQTNSYQYDALGNLVEKSDYAKVIEYPNAAKPHQARKAWADAAKTQLLADYNYDANGNLTSSTGLAAQTRNSVYNHQMVPTSITRGSASSLFAYDESNERYFERHISNGKTEKVYKLGKAFELKFTTEAGVTTEEEQHYLGANAQLMYKKAQHGKPECYQWRYLHTDRLGSIETITNQSRAVIERSGFDPFGKPREANWMLDTTRDGTTNTEKGLFSRVTTRGYTGHDHIDSVGVIHMNGRAYDPELGRFMGVDPFMQAPLNAQSLNPYSYVMNNPLAGTDPTGYCSAETGSHVKTCRDVEIKATNKDTGASVSKTVSVNTRHQGDVNSKVSNAIADTMRKLSDNGAKEQTGGSSAKVERTHEVESKPSKPEPGVATKPTGNQESNQDSDSTSQRVTAAGSAGIDRNKQRKVGGTLTVIRDASDRDKNVMALKFYQDNEQKYQDTNSSKEVMGFLILGGDGKYYVTDSIIVPDRFKFNGIVEMQKDATIVGILHTHPGGSFNQEHFSEDDVKTADEGMDYFLRTPRGDVRFINATISATQKAGDRGTKPGVSICPSSPCLSSR